MGDTDDGSFEDFGDTEHQGLGSGGLELGGQLQLPDSLTDPLAQPSVEPDYYQPIPPPVHHEPENLLQQGYDWVTNPDTTEPGYPDPVEQERIEQDMAAGKVIDETVIKSPEIDY